MGTFEQIFKRIKVKDRIALAESFSFQRKQIPHDLAEHEMVQRFSHVEKFLKRPGINTAMDKPSGSTTALVNKNFEVAGTNMTTALATFNADGGIIMTTAGALNDQCILQLQQDTNMTAMNTLNWYPTKKIRFATTVSFGSVNNIVFLAGFKLTSGSWPATDVDQVMFYFTDRDGAGSLAAATATAGSVQAVYSLAGTDKYAGSAANTTTEAGFSVDTDYDLLIEVDASRIPRFYLDGDLIATGTAFASGSTPSLKPFVEIHSGTAEARDVKIRYLALSRDI